MVKVRGITVLTRKQLVTRQFGSDAWARFYDDIARAHSCFRTFITPDSLIPLSAFLAFHDELMRRFFAKDDASHLALGRCVSQVALNEGPFRALKEKRDLASLVQTLPGFHRAYFAETTTHSQAALLADGVEFRVLDLPEWHPYFEQLIIGFIGEVLEIFCANPIRAVRLRGGGRDYAYLFGPSRVDSARRNLPRREERARMRAATSELSQRELDVLLLIAAGKTNEEIAAALGISAKTAQHHVARAYRKIGVPGRVGAALWMAERGFLGRR